VVAVLSITKKEFGGTLIKRIFGENSRGIRHHHIVKASDENKRSLKAIRVDHPQDASIHFLPEAYPLP
jgi:hypothetical protein